MPLLPAGPYRTLTTVEGHSFPYYIVPFDADGHCIGPQTREHLLAHCTEYSDVFVFSHGWNNDWTSATNRYEEFIKGFQAQRKSLGLAMPAGWRPLLVGVFWPSQALEWFDSETGPGFAAETGPAAQDAASEASSRLLADIAAELPRAQRARFFALATAESLNEADAHELATLLASTTASAGDDEAGPAAAPSADDLLAAAAGFDEPEPDYDAVGTVGGDGSPAAVAGGAPQAAFGLGDVLRKIDPRQILKPFTVWQMKDRAGKVGGHGVAELLAGLLAKSTARVHVLGHSYGCKVVMTAVCALPDGLRKVQSALLLQPAVSQYAFATDVPDHPGVHGGFRKALARVASPIVATFSDNDVPLNKMFHLSMRRAVDLGEQPSIAGGPPSVYCALGGYGPQASDALIVDILDPPKPYAFGPGGRIVGVRGTRTISGHGDINNPSTWWIAYTLASQPSPA